MDSIGGYGLATICCSLTISDCELLKALLVLTSNKESQENCRFILCTNRMEV